MILTANPYFEKIALWDAENSYIWWNCQFYKWDNLNSQGINIRC